MKEFINLYFVIFVVANTSAYKPVVIFHGILSGSESMGSMQQFIESDESNNTIADLYDAYISALHCFVLELEMQAIMQWFVHTCQCNQKPTPITLLVVVPFPLHSIVVNHPGTKVYNCDLYSNWYSLENAWKQVSELQDYLERIGILHPEGIIVLGYSQGGLLARTAIQSMRNHNVKVFISLSSPQAGQYGTSFLHLIFPDLAAKTAYELFYSNVGQHTSVGNYWNDPHKQNLYRKYSVFLPYINNEISTVNSTYFKQALIRLEKMVLIGGPNDGVITPWQSSHFGYYNETLDVIPLNKREIYTSDAIGLKTLSDLGKLVIVVKPFVHHLTWHTNKHVIQEVIMPHLT